MVEEHGNELGIFGKVEPIFELKEGEEKFQPAQLSDMVGTEIPKMLEDKSVLEQIDLEIEQTTSAHVNR